MKSGAVENFLRASSNLIHVSQVWDEVPQKW